ncbi:MAG: hypothetical protein Q4Q07_03795 [Tissierellia bacterium]|nr:hypothetical protein [Tissierellia bacterium]
MKKYIVLFISFTLILMMAGCDVIKNQKGSMPSVEDDQGKPDSVLSTKKLGTIPGRAILDYSPKASEEPLDVGVKDPVHEDLEEEDNSTTSNGKEDLSEDSEINIDDIEDEEEEEDINPEEELHMDGKSIEDLTPVKDYLVDYEKDGRWVREVLYKEGDRYNHVMGQAKIPESLTLQARDYFNYMTEINDYLGGIKGFENMDLDVTLKYSYQYLDTPNMVFYFREYIPKTLMTTGNEGKVVINEDGRLIHYLAFGRRNPNVLHYEPRYDEKTAEKLVWRRFNNKLHGYVDDYLLTDLYLKIPTEGDYTKMSKQFRPQWFGEFRNEENSYLIPYPDYRK